MSLTARHYQLLRSALPPGFEPDERQERYLRWLSRWDDETAEVVASLFRAALESASREQAELPRCDRCNRYLRDEFCPWCCAPSPAGKP